MNDGHLGDPTRRLGWRLRLSSRQEYQRVFASPCRTHARYLRALVRRNGTDYPRLGFAIARKNISKATVRNRIKRVIRESFRHHKEILMGLDIVVLARPIAASCTKYQLHKDLEQLWQNVQTQCRNC